MSRASFVSEGSVACLTPSVLQTKHSYHRVRMCATHARISIVSFVSYWHKVSVMFSYWYKGFWVQQHNVLAYLQVQAVLPLWLCPQRNVEQYDIIRYKRLLRLHIGVVFSSDTTGFSHPHISLGLTITHLYWSIQISAPYEGEVQVLFFLWSDNFRKYSAMKSYYCKSSV